MAGARERAWTWSVLGLLGGLLVVAHLLPFRPLWSWRHSLGPVGSTYFPLPAVLFGEETSTSTYLVILVYLLLTSVFGALCVVKPLLSSEGEGPLPPVLLAGLLPGYLCFSAINRLVSLGFDHAWAPLVSLFLEGLAVAAVLVHTLHRRRIFKPPNWRSVLATLAVLTLLLGSLAFQVQYGRCHVLGDGSKFFWELLDSGPAAVGASGHFPVLAQHSDEILFLYPLLYGLEIEVGARLLVPFWLLGAASKASALALLYLALRQEVRPVFAGAVAALVTLGSTSVLPGWTPVLFDSFNPVFYVPGPGRVISSILPIVGFVLLHRLFKEPPRLMSAVPIGLLLGLGLSLTTVSNLVVVGALLLYGLMLSTAHGARGVLEGLMNRWALLALLAMAFVVLTYGHPGAYLSWGLALSSLWLVYLAGLTIRGGWGALWSLVERRGQGLGSAWWATLALLVGLLVGLAFLGNVGAQTVYGALSDLLGIEPPVIVERLVSGNDEAIGTGNYQSLGLSIIAPNLAQIGHASIYHYDLGSFMRKYGLAFMLSVLFFVRLSGRPMDEVHTRLGLAVWVSLLFFYLGFFLYDFTNGGEPEFLQVWVKSRFVEPWFYSVTALGLLFLYNGLSSVREKRLMLACVLVWTVWPWLFPFVPHRGEGSGIHQVLGYNVPFVVEHALGMGAE